MTDLLGSPVIDSGAEIVEERIGVEESYILQLGGEPQPLVILGQIDRPSVLALEVADVVEVRAGGVQARRGRQVRAMRAAAVPDHVIAGVLFGDWTPRENLTQRLDRAERPRAARDARARQRLGYACKALREALADAERRGLSSDEALDQDPPTIRTWAERVRAMASVFEAEQEAETERSLWFEAGRRMHGEIPSPSVAAELTEKQLAEQEVALSAARLLVYVQAQPELTHWDIARARGYIERYGEGARPTLDRQLQRVRHEHGE